ncbi:MAG: hypothetical protein AAFO58_09875 [Pseudomonadota bacterium]
MSTSRVEVPDWSHLAAYEGCGHVDAYRTDVPQNVALADYAEAFFSTPVFRLERSILGVFGAGTDDGQVTALAQGHSDAMAAWVVEARSDRDLLLEAGGGVIRTWLGVEPTQSGTTLYFGSAVLNGRGGKPTLAARVLMPFHHLYSRTLLALAARTLR